MDTLSQQAATELFRSDPDDFINVGAGEVAYRRVGTGPDVLFVHGWPVSGATWRKLLPYLADHMTCHVIDLPAAGSSRYDDSTPLSIQHHIDSTQRVIDYLGVNQIAVVGHDSGGLIARHAVVGDDRLAALGLIDTEPVNPGWRFKAFVAGRKLPGFETGLGWVAGQPSIRRLKLVFGDAFVDTSLLDGEFAEFFFQPLHDDPTYRRAAMKVFRSFEMRYVTELANIHPKLDVPTKLVWGKEDKFFPVERAEAMVSEFPNASIQVLAGVGLLSQEEAPAEVAQALLPTLTGNGR